MNCYTHISSGLEPRLFVVGLDRGRLLDCGFPPSRTLALRDFASITGQ
jgi:hypothetical protein